jgi:uncharacterized protein YjbI with pentapeptide repeats
MNIFRLITCTVFVLTYCGCNAAEKKEVRASEIINLMKKGKPVQMVNKIILDDIDFTAAGEPYILNANMLRSEVQSNIFFDGCVFMGKVTSNGKHGKTPIQTCFKNNLTFIGCDFRGEVDFDGAVVFGMVHFGRSIFRENAKFNNMAVWAKDSYFTEMKAEKNFQMIYASFLGNLSFLNAVFDGNASFQETSVKGKLVFNNAAFAERAGFDLIEVWGSAFFNYAKFEKIADFSNARFMHTADFVNVSFAKPANFENTFFMNNRIIE